MSAYAAVVLAAGQGTRFRAASGRDGSKLLAPLDGRPLVRRVAETALATRAAPVVVVTGSEADAVRAALVGLPLAFAHNPRFAKGLATSLQAGLAAVPPQCAGALVFLGDMPWVEAGTADALIARALAVPEADAVVPLHGGRRGNPVLLSRRLFAAVADLEGDQGARVLLRDPALRIEAVADTSPAVLHDVDLPADLGPALPART